MRFTQRVLFGWLFVLSAVCIGQSPPPAIPDRIEPADDEQVSRLASGSGPEQGAELSATVGEVMYAEFSGREYAWAVLKTDVLPSSSHGVVLRRGSLLWALGSSGEPDEFCLSHEQSRYCFWDRNKDGRFDRVHIVGGGRPSQNLAVPFEVVWRQAPTEAGAARRECVYLGVGGRILRLVYREYAGDLERPVSSHEVTFDLAPSGATVIAFKDARIEILSADNSGIRYRVLSGFKQ